MPLYTMVFSGLWDDDALEGLPFEAKGLFVYLFTNHRVRPSGIYRASDDQLVADTDLSPTRVREHLKALVDRGRVIRDGSWIFVIGYLKRQPKHEKLLLGARRDIENCSSQIILEAFASRYPMFSKWSADRLQTISRPSTDLPPSYASASSSALNYNYVEPSADGSGSPPLAGPMGPAASPELTPNPELPRNLKAIAERITKQLREGEPNPDEPSAGDQPQGYKA